MSPTNRNDTLPTTKPLAVSALVTQKTKKAAPKASTTTITTNGEDIAGQILQGTYVHDSDHAIHAALLPCNGVVGISCLCCNLVGVNKRYSSISYTQSHGEKCKYHDIMCGWLSEHPDLHSLIPYTANLKGKLVLAPQPPTIPVGDAFNLITLTKLQGELNKKLLKVKVAANRLADYTKILVDVPVVPVPVSTTSPTVVTVNNGDITDAIITTVVPVGNPSLGTNTAVNPPLGSNHLGNPQLGTTVRSKRKRKQSVKAKEADYLI